MIITILACPISFHCTDVTEFTHQTESQLHRWLEFQVDEAQFTPKLSTVSPTCTTPSRGFREFSSARCTEVWAAQGSILSFSEVRAMWLLSTRHDLVPSSPDCTLKGLVWPISLRQTASTRSKATTPPMDTYRIRTLYGHNRANDAFSSASGKRRDAGNNSLPLKNLELIRTRFEVMLLLFCTLLIPSLVIFSMKIKRKK